jgi:hypothetical protein
VRRFILIITIIILLCHENVFTAKDKPFTEPTESELKKASLNFLEIARLYDDWNDKIFGKSAYCRQKLVRVLRERIGEYILTDYNFALISPESMHDRKVICRFYYEGWLKIEGRAEIESIKKLIGGDIEKLKRWWRSGSLIAVYGKIRKFRLGMDSGGRHIVLYLADIHVMEK